MPKNLLEQLKQAAENLKPKQSVYQEEDKTLSLYIYGSIYKKYREDDSYTDAKWIQKFLDEHKDAENINVYINSNGGDVFEGIAIYNQLKRANAKVHVFVDGIAASIASIIAMAGEDITMPKSSMLMIHNCYTFACGNAQELRKTADDLDKIMNLSRDIYLEKAGEKLTLDKLNELLDNESYLTADECIKYGLANAVVDDAEPEPDEPEQHDDKQYQMFIEMMQRYEKENQAVKTQNKNEDTGFFGFGNKGE